MNANERKLILAIDVGNTRAKFGVFESAPRGAANTTLPECIASIAVPSAKPVNWDDISAAAGQAGPQIGAAILAGVNPAAEAGILSTWPDHGWPKPRVLRRATELPVQANVNVPDHVGIDRLLNAVAANVLRPADRATITISAGTATTIDLVTASGVFAGGAILPGLELGARALHEHTAFLPLIDVAALAQQQVDALGKDTRSALCSGLWYGQVGAIRELVAQLSELAGQAAWILVTGGNGRWLAPALGAEYRFEPDLALRGLAFVGQLNAGSAEDDSAREAK